MVVISKVTIKYTGTLIKFTNKLNEEINNKHIKNVKDLLEHLKMKYGQDIISEIKNNFNIIIYRNNEQGFIVDKDKWQDTKLKGNNKVMFFYPFTGG